MKRFVIFMTPLSFGGGEQQVSLQLKYLKKKGFNIIVYNLAKSEEFEKKLKEYNINFITLVNNNLGFSPSLKDYFVHLVKYVIVKLFNKRYFKFSKNDIIWAHGFEAAIVGFLIKKLYNIKYSIFTRHSMPSSNKYFVKIIYNKILSSYDVVTAVSPLVKNKLIQMYPFLKDRIFFIPNGIELEKFLSNPNPNLKKQLNISENDIVAIYVARMSKSKNHNFLVKLMENIKKENFKLILIGDGEERKNIENLIKKKNLNNRIYILGYIKNEEIPNYIAISDISLFPSKNEGFGISIIESLAGKCPVIMFKEIYLNVFKDGVIVANDDKDFIKKTEDLINNKETLNLYKVKAFEIAKLFDIENIVDKYIKLFYKKGIL